MESKQHFLYVLECSDGSYYAGYTNDLKKRIRTHNEGKGAKYTRGRIPVTLLFSKSYATKNEALRAEWDFKQLKTRQKKEQFIAKENKLKYVATKQLSKR
ncbi:MULTISPECIES: GIY-YIG nuclease family protein [Bacillaceae]|uniref:GIY-YIG nuclease family protein n=1 Tax=Bacillaceae TaxID=186817 RepID=UPI002A133D43|nr:GIY-YIG nuclease family protein [Cytobacillus sp. IB215316]MDX8363119.1 GIY-YIG nuclease family protein [Cytobacillus sp. IB215316]